MQEKSESRSFTAVWLCLFLYSGLFALLQAFILPPLHLPDSLSLILCAGLSVIPILWHANHTGLWRLYPVTGMQRPPVLTFLYLLSLILILNLLVSSCAPAIEHILNLIGIGVRQGAPADTAFSPSLTLYICIIAPIIEELIYRGVVLHKVLPYGTRLAIVLSAVCFGLMHHDFYQGIAAALGGLVYGYAAVRYSLAVSICLHIANNSIASLLPLLKSFGTPASLFILLFFFLAGVFVLIGSVIVIRRKSFKLPQSVSFPSQPRAILPHPALWLVLLFDTVMLIALSFTRV